MKLNWPSLTIISALLIGSTSDYALAKDEWFCTEEASAILNGVIQACGIGVGKDEATARLNAFDSAQMEFRKICDVSDDCRGHELTVDPKRTTCKPTGENYKCYRMVAFEIQEGIKSGSHKTELKINQRKVTGTQVTTSTTRSAELNFSGEPKLRKGMKKSEVMSMFGMPVSADKTSFHYKDRTICLYSTSLCFIHFSSQGLVVSWSQFKPELTTDLDDEPAVGTAAALQSWDETIPLNHNETLHDSKNIQWSPAYFKSQVEYCNAVLDSYTKRNASKITILKKALSSPDYKSMKEAACFHGLYNVSQTTSQEVWSSASLSDLEKAYGEVISARYINLIKECPPIKMSPTTSELKPTGSYLGPCALGLGNFNRNIAGKPLNTLVSEKRKAIPEAGEIRFDFNKCELVHSSFERFILEKIPLAGFDLSCIPSEQISELFKSEKKADVRYICTMKFNDGKAPFKQIVQVDSSFADLRLYVVAGNAKNIHVDCEKKGKQCTASWNVYSSNVDDDINYVSCKSDYQKKPAELLNAHKIAPSQTLVPKGAIPIDEFEEARPGDIPVNQFVKFDDLVPDAPQKAKSP